MEGYDNVNPFLFEKHPKREEPTVEELDFNIIDDVDSQEVFEIICGIKDPEYMETTLEELHIVTPEMIQVDNTLKHITVEFKPTVPNCSMPSLIGLCLKTILTRSFPSFKIFVKILPGSHALIDQINKQLSDKERIRAALEGEKLNKIVKNCLKIQWDNRNMLALRLLDHPS